MSNEKFKVKFGLAVGDTAATVDGTTGNIVTNGDIAVNGGDITTTSTTANIFTTNATSISIGGAGTNTPTDLILIGVNGQTYGTAFGGLITQNGYTTQAASRFTAITQTTPYLVMSTTRKSMKCVVTVTDTITGAIHSLEILAIRKTSTTGAWLTTYAEVYSDAPLATFTVTDVGTSLNLYATPASTNSTNISVLRNSLGD